jgi:predicted ester cyclase
MPEDAKTLLRRLYDEVGAGNLGVIDELVADNFIDHEEFPGLEPNKEGLKQFFSMLHSAFPDLRMEVHQLLADDDLASARVTATGTHEGEFMGLQPGGRWIDVQIFDIVRISDGQVTEHWGVVDAMTMMRQLGAVPEVPA